MSVFRKAALTPQPDNIFAQPDNIFALPDEEPKRRRLTFWVRTSIETANLRGNCDGVQIHRSGALIIFAEGGKRHHLADGHWLECTTETLRGDG
jgi:hypothetical protein